MSAWKIAMLAAAAILAVARFAPAQDAVSPQSGAEQTPAVRIGSKNGTENVVLGEILTQLAAATGAKAVHQEALGGTLVVFKALQHNELDLYAEYTGTLSAEILQAENVRTDDEIRAALARRGIRMSKHLGFNNTYALGMRAAAAEELGLTAISQLAEPRFHDLRIGISEEFSSRGDGWPGLARTYRLPHRPKVLDHNLAYRGLASGSLDITDLYSTDAEIRYYDLRLLEDDRGYFPSYHCVLLYRADLESRAPEVVESILRLEGAIDNAAMMEMNSQNKLDQVPPQRIAARFLSDSFGFAPPAAAASPARELLKGLLHRTWQHLFLVGVSLAAAIVVALPLGIAAYKFPRVGNVILGATGILQTLPAMAVLVFMIPLLGLGARPAILALFLYSLLPIVRGAYAGLKEIPGHLTESAIVLGLPAGARLWHVELPMASRSILSGIKTAAVINVGTATIGALIAAGGYGELIIAGIRQDSLTLILQGAIPAAAMALLVQGGFDLLERLVVPRGLRLAAGQ
jgi:osmoprotectant transport system permease protein